MLELCNIPEQLYHGTIYAFTYAEGGAMSCPGMVNVIADVEGKVEIYSFNTMINQNLFEQLKQLLPQFVIFLEKNELEETWKQVYMGAGNHLFLLSNIYLKLKKKYALMTEGAIYESCLEEILSICRQYDVANKFTLLEAVKGDITKIQYCEAIVNAANQSLLGGGGVDGAIHKAAGRGLYDACKKLHGCKIGEAKITKAFELPCKYVIHTPGPVWEGGLNGESRLLENCYVNSLKLAADYEIHSIAFPSISTGAYRYPVKKAAYVAVEAVRRFIEQNPDLFDRITWVLFDEHTKEVYEETIKERKYPFMIYSSKELASMADEAIQKWDKKEMSEQEIIEEDAEFGYCDEDD